MRRSLILLLAAALVFAACGGSDGTGDAQATTSPASDDNETEATTASASDETDPTTATPTTGDAGGETDAPAPDASVGTLTVAGETYLFADTGFPGLQCMPSAFGVAFLSGLQFVDENGEGLDGSLAVNIPFKGEEETAGILPAVTGNVGDLEWIADPEHADLNSIPQGSSQVDSYEINGNTITGAATFYEENSSFGGSDLIVEQGTFEVTCADG